MQNNLAQSIADETTLANKLSKNDESSAADSGEQAAKRMKLDDTAASSILDPKVSNEAQSSLVKHVEVEIVSKAPSGGGNETSAIVRASKKKYALLIGYSGEGYFGLQRNSSIKNGQFRTIEDEIVDGLVKINAIPQNHADEMFKVND
jgi:hypothetical protein